MPGWDYHYHHQRRWCHLEIFVVFVFIPVEVCFICAFWYRNLLTPGGLCDRLKRKREIGSVPAFVLEHSCLGARGSAKTIAQPMRGDNCSRKVWKLAKKSIEDRSEKISQSMRVENRSRKVLEVGEKVHRRSLQEKFPNRCASKIAQGKSWKLAKKSIEDHCKKNPQPISLQEKFPNRYSKLNNRFLTKLSIELRSS